MKKLTYTIIFNLLVQLSIVGQIAFDSSKVSDTVLSICSTITKDTILMEDKVGYAAMEPEQWRVYLKLNELTTDTILFELTNHPAPIVRGYAFLGLMDKNSDLLMNASVWYFGSIVCQSRETLTIKH